MLIISLGILAALFVAAAVIDLKARRRRTRIRIDGGGVLNARRINQAEGNVRSDGTLRNGGFGSGLGGF